MEDRTPMTVGAAIALLQHFAPQDELSTFANGQFSGHVLTDGPIRVVQVSPGQVVIGNYEPEDEHE